MIELEKMQKIVTFELSEAEKKRFLDTLSQKFGNVKLWFDSYYEYSFYFVGAIDDVEIEVGYGGDYDEIYRFNVKKDHPECFDPPSKWLDIIIYFKKHNSIVYFQNGWNIVTIYKKKGG